MSERDPKIEAKPGDVFFKAGKRPHFTRVVRRVKDDEVLYQDGFGQVCATTVGGFARWAKDAEVIARAE